MTLDKNSFDAALIPGVRDALANSNQHLRHAESEEFRRLLDDSGNFLPSASTERNCPLCSTSHAHAKPELVAHGMHLIRCDNCRLVYSREIINPDFERQRYKASKASDANFGLKENTHYAHLEQAKARYVVNRLTAWRTPGSLLDIGSSTGALLEAAETAGWKAYGIELNDAAARRSTALGHRVAHGAYPEAMPADWREFQAITALDVLEHMPTPLDFITSVGKLLPRNGWLAIQVPNFSSLLLTIEGARNNNFCHGHWSYFEPATLTATMQKAGFAVRFLETYISELDRILNYSEETICQAWHKLTGSPLSVPQALTPSKLHEAMLGYKLFGLFQKISD